MGRMLSTAFVAALVSIGVFLFGKLPSDKGTPALSCSLPSSLPWAPELDASLRGKSVVVTGASKGIGEQLAYTAARHSAHLVLTARSQALLGLVAERCRFLGAASVEIKVADMGSETDVRQLSQVWREVFLAFADAFSIAVHSGEVAARGSSRPQPRPPDPRTAMDRGFCQHLITQVRISLPFFSADQGMSLQNDAGHQLPFLHPAEQFAA